MKLIGIKRLILLAILIGINATVAAAYFLWVSPMREEAQNKLAAAKSEISRLQGKIENTKTELKEYKDNLPQYQSLEKRGFMSGQDRFQISRDLDTVRQSANLGGFSFRIDDLKLVENTDAQNANMKVLNSRINVDNVGALLDINMFDFIDRMSLNFPAHTRLHSFKIDRRDPLNALTLNKIAAKGQVSLISATAVFDWFTYVPAALPADPNAPQPGR